MVKHFPTGEEILVCADRPTGVRRLYRIRKAILDGDTADQGDLQWLADAIGKIILDNKPSKVALQLEQRRGRRATAAKAGKDLQLAWLVVQAMKTSRQSNRRDAALDLISAQEKIPRDTLERHYKKHRRTALGFWRLQKDQESLCASLEKVAEQTRSIEKNLSSFAATDALIRSVSKTQVFVEYFEQRVKNKD